MEVEHHGYTTIATNGRQTPISATAGPSRFLPATTAANGTLEVTAANCIHCSPKLRRRLASSGRSTEREHEQRTEENQGCEITVDDEMNQRPEGHTPQERVAGNSNHPPRDVGPLCKL